MREIISKVHLGLSWLAVAAIAAQFFFAGLGIFGATDFGLHRATGYGIALGSLLLLLLAAGGRLGRMRVGLSGLLLVLAFVQSLLPKGPPLVAALHPLNALLVLGCAVALARAAMPGQRRARPSAGSPEVSAASLAGKEVA